MNRLNNPLKIAIFCILAILISIGISQWFNLAKPHDLMLYLVTCFSASIAVFALIVSIQTYISIDSVNAMSKMDGNVMENENYRTSIFSIICKFSKNNKDDAGGEILTYIEGLLKKEQTKSGATLADSIQNVIDIVVLLAFVIHKKDSSQKKQRINKRLRKIIKTLNSKVRSFERVSDGSCILIKESVNLIKAVIYYQCHQCGYQTVEIFGKDEYIDLIDVRGTMLKNAVSRTLYYNYTGLTCMQKAKDAILDTLKIDNKNYDITSLEASKLIKGISNHLIDIYLNQALKNFDIATSIIGDDIMWNLFILYNKARVQYIQSLLHDNGSTDWLETMGKAIDYRYQFAITLDDMINTRAKIRTGNTNTSDSFFQRAFKDQYHLAQLMNIRLCYASGFTDKIDIQQLEYFKQQILADEFQHYTRFKDDIETIIRDYPTK